MHFRFNPNKFRLTDIAKIVWFHPMIWKKKVGPIIIKFISNTIQQVYIKYRQECGIMDNYPETLARIPLHFLKYGYTPSETDASQK